jgi:putative transposase
LLHIKVHAANLSDTKEGVAVMQVAFAKYPTLVGVCGDAGYRGTFVKEVEILGLRVDIVERLGGAWELLPKRWRVERTFAWMGNSRRLSKDYEISTESAEAMAMISHIATLLKRF